MRVVDLIGYRCWRITHTGYLRSLAMDTIWLPGEPMCGKIPDDGRGRTGVYVFRGPSAAIAEVAAVSGSGSFAIGSVLLWGEVVEHERGYRAERAKIKTIDDAVWDGKPPRHSESRAALAFLRERYGVGECAKT